MTTQRSDLTAEAAAAGEPGRQQDNRQLAALTDRTPGVAYTLTVSDDGARDFSFVSPACAEIYGFSAETAMADARHLHEAIHPPDRRSFHEAGRRALQQMGLLRWEGRIVRPDGKVRLVTITSRPQPRASDAGATWWHGLVVERTTPPEASTDAPTEQTTNGQAAGSGGTGPVNRDTLAILGHDIGAPLTAITIAADLAMQVLESPAGPGSERHEELLRCLWAVQRNAARLELLRDGLLTMVSQDTGRLTAVPAPVLVAPRLEAAVALVGSPSRVAVECPAGLTCWVQPSHLDQMDPQPAHQRRQVRRRRCRRASRIARRRRHHHRRGPRPGCADRVP